MTEVYFVRHAEPNYKNHDDMSRELTAKGMADRRLVSEFLTGRRVDVLLSSPYKRAFDTIADYADQRGIDIHMVDGFRERKVDNTWIDDFDTFTRKQWEDFDYKLSDGESLREVQKRNIRALNQVLNKYQGRNIAIGSHGTALSTIINYYDHTFGYTDFQEVKYLMPWIVHFSFEGLYCVGIDKHNLLIR